MYESLVAEYLNYELPAAQPRTLQINLEQPKRRNIIRSIIGVRRCGKTFLLFQMMRDLRNQGVSSDLMLYFPFDDERLAPMNPTSASEVIEAYYQIVPQAKQGCYLFFDEIQEIPEWDSFVRRVAEQENVTMVITGSSSKLLSTDIPTKLRGRSLSDELWPLSFYEYCSFHNVKAVTKKLSRTRGEEHILEHAMRDYLDVGGFPAIQDMDATDRVRMLQTYADEIVTKDVLERFETTSYRVGRRFARTALRSTGLKLSVNKQINALRSSGLSISSESAYALLDDFEDAHLIFKVSDFDRSIKDNPRSSYKVYSVDQGLSLAVAPASHLDLGQRLETAVFIELKRRFGSNRDMTICSYSAPGCPEVDFIVGDVLLTAGYDLIQVALSSGVKDGVDADLSFDVSSKYKSEIGNLRTAMRLVELKEATLITLDEEDDITFDEGTVHIVPAWKWFLGNRS